MPDDDGSHPPYSPVAAHRNNAPGKSQWSIPPTDELQVFQSADQQGWLLAATGWGLHLPDSQPAYLGITQDRQTRVFVAKFVSDPNHGYWHGYPADHRRHPQDIPDDVIQLSWLQNAVLSKAKIRKLAKGQPCTL